jgi:hypothetical protein
MVDVAQRRLVSLLSGLWALGGCSLLYNPDNLPAPARDAEPSIDQAIGREIDASVDASGEDHALAITAAAPHVLFEGQGVGGSRPAILVITGRNIADDAVVTLVPTVAAAAGPMIEIDNAHAVRSGDHTMIAVPVSLAIDVGRGAGDVALTVQIAQAGGSVMAPLDGQVRLHTLPELDAPPTGALALLYSRVQLTSTLTFAPSASAGPVVIRAVSSIDVRDVHVDANQSVAGPGGGAGGAAGHAGTGPGGGLGGGLLNGGVLMAGSGGGFGSAGGVGKPAVGGTSIAGGPITGDDFLAGPGNQSSGGGGGSIAAGGGGGGSLELTAGGTLKANTISANGGAGGNDALLSAAAGGGAGGAILLRAGGAATISKVTVAGGGGGDHSLTGAAVPGNGGDGRLRYDLPAIVGTPTLPAANRAGVSFSIKAGDNPLVMRDPLQGLAVTTKVSATSSNAFDVYVFDADLTQLDTQNVTFTSPSPILKPRLLQGYNHVCVTPHGRNPVIDAAATTCLDVAYIP